MKHRILICTLLAVMLPLVVLAQPKPVRVTKPTAKKPTVSRSVPRTAAAKPAPAKPLVAKPATVAATAAKPALPAPPPSLAVVNGSPVAQGHLDQAIANRWAGPIMRAIIDDRLVRQEARRLGIKATPEEVGARLKIAREKYSSEAAFERHLLAEGFTTAGFTEKLTTDILLDKLLAHASAVTAQEAQKYYEQHKSEYSSPAEIRLFTVTTGTIEDAYLVRERLAAGEKLEAIAKELSQDAAKANGGDNGWVRAANLPEKPYADALFAMEPGVVSSPLRAGGKYVIALVKERKPEQMISFQQAQKDIVAGLQAEKAVSRDEYLRILERKA
ncbi:MAG: peptidyl-prolyl cis-trans isomerase, partial [Bacteroidota bacterium]